MSTSADNCDVPLSRGRSENRSLIQKETTVQNESKKRRRSVRGRRSSIGIVLREVDGANNCVEVEVPLEESAAKDSVNEPSQKQALHEAEITELHNYANELDEEMKRWKELLDEEEHCVSEAKRDVGPKKISSEQFEEIRKKYLNGEGPLYVFDQGLENSIRKAEREFTSKGNIDLLRNEVERLEMEVKNIEEDGVRYLNLLNEESEEDLMEQLSECDKQLELLRSWATEKGLSQRFDAIMEQCQ